MNFQESHYSAHEGPQPLDVGALGSMESLGDLGAFGLGALPVSNDDFGVLIAEENPSSGWLMLAQTLAGGTAAALSYKKNRSILWALGAWFIWPAALPYYLITKEG